MQNEEFREIEEKLRKVLKPSRFQHTLGVCYTASALAMVHGADVEKARLAGLLHDCAKSIPGEDRLGLCEKYGIEVSPCERINTTLLHAKLGAYLAKKEYGVRDEDVLNAIRFHTTGRPDMSLLEEIVYVADLIEPNRDDELKDELNELRQLAFTDLKAACALEMKMSIGFLLRDEKPMDEFTLRAYEAYKYALK